MKKIEILIVLAFFALNVLGQITVQTEMPKKIQAGSIFEVKLKIKNDYNQNIKITLKDKIIINSSGINIECLEQTVKANNETELRYPGITINAAGDYNLGKALIEYTNPNTKKQKTATTKNRKIKVTGNIVNGLNKIETIYQCKGVTSKSTQISTGSITTSITTNLPQGQPSNPEQNQHPAQNNPNTKNQARPGKNNIQNNTNTVPITQQKTRNAGNQTTEQKQELHPKEKQGNWVWAAVIFLVAAITAFIAYKKYNENKTKTGISEPVKKEEISESKKKLLLAVKEFEKGNKKEAYLLAGQAIRSCIKQKKSIQKEITQQEALNLSKKQGYYKQLKKAFQLISMVGFAKYKPNKKDFEYITKIAEKIM